MDLSMSPELIIYGATTPIEVVDSLVSSRLRECDPCSPMVHAVLDVRTCGAVDPDVLRTLRFTAVIDVGMTDATIVETRVEFVAMESETLRSGRPRDHEDMTYRLTLLPAPSKDNVHESAFIQLVCDGAFMGGWARNVIRFEIYNDDDSIVVQVVENDSYDPIREIPAHAVLAALAG